MRLLISILLLCCGFSVSAQPAWDWAQANRSSSDERIRDIVTDPATGDHYVVGYFQGGFNQEYPTGLNGTPNMTNALGIQDGFVGKHDVTGAPIWGFKIGGPGAIVSVKGIARAASGNIFISGDFNGNVEFQGVSTSITTNLVSNGDDTFIASYDAAGNLLWVVTGSGPGENFSNGIVVNSSNVYVAGWFGNTVTFTGGGPIVANDQRDAYLVCYSQAGAFQWQRMAGDVAPAAWNDRGWTVTADNNNVYLAGTFHEILQFPDPPLTNISTFTPGVRSIFIAEYNANTGARTWQERIGGNQLCRPRGLAIDANRIYMTGGMEGNVNLPGAGVFVVPGSGEEIYTLALSRTTKLLDWIHIEENNNINPGRGTDLTVDPLTSRLYISGVFHGTTQFDGGNAPQTSAGAADAFVMSRATTGAFQWVETGGSTTPDWGITTAFDNLGGVYLGGYYTSAITFGPLNLPNDAGENAYHARLSVCDASFSYSKNTYCRLIDANPTPTITGNPAGSFTSSPPGLSINGSSGLIDLQASAPGAYTVTYTAPLLCSQNQSITVSNDCWRWADGRDDPGFGAANSIAIDSVNQFVYACGVIENAAPFPQILVSEMNGGAGNGAKDGYVAKYDFNGNLLWAFNIGGTQDDEATGITVNQLTGDIFITGYLRGDFATTQTQMDGHIAGAAPNVGTAYGNADIFVAAYSPAGALLWFEVSGGTLDDRGMDITATANGLYSTGWYENSATIGGFPTTLSYNTELNTYIVAHGFGGTAQWLTTAGTDDDDGDPMEIYQDKNMGIAADANAVYAIGMWSGNNIEIRDASGAIAATATDPTPSGQNTYVLSYLANGNYNWHTLYDETSTSSWGMDVAVDCDGVYITTSMHNGSTTPGGTAIVSVHDNGVIAGLNRATGAENWVFQLNSTQNHQDYGFAIEADGYGNVYVGGTVRSDPLEMGIPNNGSLTGATGKDPFLLKLNTNGVYQWAERMDGADDDWLLGLAVYRNVEVFACGIFGTQLDLPQQTVTAATGDNPWVAVRPVVPTGSYGGGSATITYGSAIYCQNGTDPTPVLTPATGTVTDLSGFVTILNPATGEIDLSASTPGGPYTILFTPTTGCPTLTQVTIEAAPTPSNAGPNQNICATSGTLAGNPPAIGTGAWATVTGPGTATTPANPNSAVTGLAVGLNQFEWVISNGTCVPSRDTIDIIVDAPPTPANAGPNQNICTTNGTLAGNAPGIGTGAWATVTGPGTATTPADPNSAVMGLIVGLNQFEWVVINGTCPPSRDTVDIIVDQAPTPANAGPNQNTCATSGTLSGNAPAVGTGAWATVTGPGTATTPSDPSSAVTGLIVGLNQFEWVVTNGTCPSSRDTVDIIVDAPPTPANAGPNQNTCGTTTTLAGNVPLVGTGLWNVITGAGTVTNPNLPNSPVTGMSIGLNQVEWVISNGTCAPSRDTVNIDVSGNITQANAGPDQNLCATTVATLAGNVPTLGTGNWNVLSGGGTVTNPAQANSGVTGLSIGPNTFEWVISNAPCTPTRDTVVILIDESPDAANAGPDLVLCGSTDTLLGANAPVVGTGLWSVFSGSGSLSNPGNPGSAVSGLSIGANSFVWTISNGVCPPSSDTVTVIRSAFPLVDLGADTTICSGNPLLLDAGNPGATYAWSTGAQTQTILAPPGLYAVTVTNQNGCRSSDAIQISAGGIGMAQISGLAIDYCVNASAVNLSGSPAGGSFSGPGINGSAFDPAASGVGLHTITYSVVDSSGCVSTDTVQTNVFGPLPANAGADAEVHFTDEFVLRANSPLPGTGMWQLLEGSGSIEMPMDSVTAVYDLAVGPNRFSWVVTLDGCVSSDEIIITRIPFKPERGFSPNGDGLNDVFEIPGLSEYPGSGIRIFNRWGQMVYEATTYGNDWDGRSHDGSALPSDTYFYVLRLNTGVEIKGYVELRRQ